MGPFNKGKMIAFLGKRYHQQTKLLDLSGLGMDPALVATGLFNNTTLESNFFLALMRVLGMNFDTLEKSRAAVDSVSLANNWLADISPVTTIFAGIPEP
jgi:nuclear RNA export factor